MPNMGPPRPTYYRYYESDYSDGYGIDIQVHEERFTVQKFTTCGVRLRICWGKSRMVYDGTLRKFAHWDRKVAMESFLARKQKQLAIVKYQVKKAEAAIKAAEDMLQFHNDNPGELYFRPVRVISGDFCFGEK